MIFTLASLACGLAGDPLSLIVARLVQGIGAGVLAPQVTSFIQTTFSGGERGRAYGLFGAVSGAATAIGTVLGGEVLALLPGEIGWRWLFWINIPLGLLGLLMALRFLPRDLHSAPRRLDLAATALLGVFIVLFLLPCSSTPPWASPSRSGAS